MGYVPALAFILLSGMGAEIEGECLKTFYWGEGGSEVYWGRVLSDAKLMMKR